MDLRSLINKLDTIDQRQLLKESEQILSEKVRLRYSDVEAVAKQYPTDEVARGQALAKLAKENGLPGLFDPVSRELVNPDGSLSTFKGADQATVQRLEQWGLLPLGAKTSSWLGMRGENEKTAMGANQTAQSRDALVDKAEALMKKAVEAAAATTTTTVAPANDGQAGMKKESVMKASGIASALMEEFGYNGIALLESISPAEHTELKKIISDLTPLAKSDPDVTDIVGQFRAYNQQRDQIIKRIMELVALIKSKPAKTTVKESLQESKARMLSEGRVQILEEGKRYLRDGAEWTYDPSTKLYSHLNEDGTVDQLDEADFWQNAGDFSRGVGSGLTAGYADNISAGIQALFTNKTYKDALKNELAKTELAKTRSPWLYYGGAGVGFIANPLSKVGLGIPLMVGQYASDKLVREPWNQSVLGQDGGATQQGGMDTNKIKAMQQELKAKGANLGSFGPNKDGIDGRLGSVTRKALEQFPEIAKKYNMSAQASAPAQAPAQASAPAQATPAQAQELVTQIKAFAKQNGISDAEAITKMKDLMSESVQQLNEFGWLLNLLKGGAEAAIKGGAEAGAKGGAEAGGSALQNTMANMVRGGGTKTLAADALPSIINRGGQTWEKVGANYINRQTKQVLSAEEMMAKGGAEATAGGAVEGEAALVSKFGDKAKTAFDKMKAGGGKILAFMKNNKFLAIAAVLATAGYIFNADGDIVTDTDQPNNPNGPVKPDQSGMDEVSPEVIELQKLVDQLNSGWPTDPETAQALAAAKEAGAKVPEVQAQGQGGMAASGSGQVSNFANPKDFAAGMANSRASQEQGK